MSGRRCERPVGVVVCLRVVAARRGRACGSASGGAEGSQMRRAAVGGGERVGVRGHGGGEAPRKLHSEW
jgi:hypothetical protein